MPFLTNSIGLEENEELILEVIEKTPKQLKQRSWKDASKEDEAAKEKREKQELEQERASILPPRLKAPRQA